MWGKIIGNVIGPVSNFFAAREERKMVDKTISAKVAMAKSNNETQVVFNEQEIDRLSKKNEGETWKDEYITIIMTLPLLTIFICTFLGVLLAQPGIIDAAKAANAEVIILVPNYQELLGITIMAGLGLRAYKTK